MEGHNRELKVKQLKKQLEEFQKMHTDNAKKQFDAVFYCTENSSSYEAVFLR